MQQHSSKITIQTNHARLYEFTGQVEAFVGETGIQTGLLTVFCPHTSASLIIQENADPTVQHDLQQFFARLVPEDRRMYMHQSEGLDDMPAHIKTALTQTSMGIPVEQGHMILGTWQGIYLFEHRVRPHTRTINLHILGD